MGHVARRHNVGGSISYQGVTRTPEGKEQTRTFVRKLDAQRWVTAQDAARQRGDWIDPTAGRQPFEPYAKEWLTTKRATVAPRTYVNLEGRLRNHLLPAFGTRALASIHPADIRTWITKLVDAGQSPASVKKNFQILNQILRTAEIDRLIGRNPATGIALPRDTHHQEMTFLNPAQITQLADKIAPRYKALIYTAAYTGLRAGELEALRIADLDLLHGTISVHASLAEIHGELHEGPTKTGHNRTVALPRFLVRMLEGHLSAHPSHTGHLFTAPEGGPIRHRAFMARHYRPAVTKAQLAPTLRFHDLRHTCAALLIAAGAHLEEIKDHLGHATIRTTSDRYGHLYQEARERLRDHLDHTYSEAHTTGAASA